MAALSLAERQSEAVSVAKSFHGQYPESSAQAFEQLCLSRSASSVYRAQVCPLFERIRALTLA